MKVNLMGKQYALNIAVTAEELKDKPAKVIRKYIRAARRCYPRLASQNNQRGYNYRWAVPTTRPCPAGRRGPFHSPSPAGSGLRGYTMRVDPRSEPPGGAAAAARGFIGIAFRTKDGQFE